jgi:transcriptional regulator with XRE-family HTH domain
MMVDIPERYTHARRELGGRLRTLRETASLTGTQTAERSGMSQPKISKIENAVLLPSVEDVETLLRVYGARTGDREQLLELARSLHATYESTRTVMRKEAERSQRQIAAIEADTHLMRTFELAWVPPLLQAPEYTRQIFTTGARIDEMAAALAARQERQLALYDEDRRFHFILTENALRVRPGPPAIQRTQLDRITSLSALPNVRVGVIPSVAELTDIPRHGFDIYDERLVTVSLETSTVTFTERRQVDRYIELYSGLMKDALWAEEARGYIADIVESLSANSPKN